MLHSTLILLALAVAHTCAHTPTLRIPHDLSPEIVLPTRDSSRPTPPYPMGYTPSNDDVSIELRKELMKAEYDRVYARRRSAKEYLPVAYDTREAFPSCEIGTILNQGDCGSCWAFGTTEALEDRFCVQGNQTLSLSEEQVLSCNLFGLENNCNNGGDPVTAWMYASVEGLVESNCWPYNSGESGETYKCDSVTSCADGSEWVKHKADILSLRWHFTETTIMEAIYEGGPVTACFLVYEDFMYYYEGVYSHYEGSPYAGSHCIKLVGWGVDTNDTGLPYWIGQNQWGKDWGMDGIVWIERGVDECLIERGVFVGDPDLST